MNKYLFLYQVLIICFISIFVSCDNTEDKGVIFNNTKNKTYNVNGIVKDEITGNFIDAKIEISSTNGSLLAVHGKYIFDRLKNGDTFVIKAFKEGYKSYTSEKITIHSNKVLNINLIPIDSGQIKGCISDDKSHLVKFVDITLKGATTRNTTSNDDGCYKLYATNGTYSISFSKIGFKSIKVNNLFIPIDGITKKDITLEYSSNKIPSSPKNLRESNIGLSSIKLTWQKSIDIDGSIENYYISYSLDNKRFSNEQTTTTTYTTINNLQDNTIYYFRIRAIDNEGSYSKYSYIRLKTKQKGNKIPLPPIDIKISNITPTSITISWEDAIDFDGQIVTYVLSYTDEYNNNSDDIYTKKTSYIFNKLQPNTSYTFKVKSIDDKGANSKSIYTELISTLYSKDQDFTQTNTNNNFTKKPTNYEYNNDPQDFLIKSFDLEDTIISALFSYDERYIFIAAGDKIQKWDLKTKQLIRQEKIISYYNNPIVGMALSKDNKYLALSLNEDQYSIQILDIHTFEEISTIIVPNASPQGIKFIPDSRFIAIPIDTNIKLCNILTGSVKTIREDFFVRSIDFSSDNQYIASSFYSQSFIQVKNIITSEIVYKYNVGKGEVSYIAYSPNNRFIASSSDTINGSKLAIYNISQYKVDLFPSDMILSLDISSDSKYILTGSANKITLWNSDGHIIRHYTKHYGNIYNISFSHSGRYALSVASHSAKLWSIVY
jgi:hypothetical protein